MAPWDNVRPHPSFKVLPALNIDFLAHADARVRETALEDLVVRVFVVLCCVLFCCVLCVCVGALLGHLDRWIDRG